MPHVENDIANADLPKKIDDVTTMTRVEINGRDVRYHFTLDKSVPVIQGAELKTAIGIPACVFWKDKFSSGKFTSATYLYNFVPSGAASFTLTQADCV